MCSRIICCFVINLIKFNLFLFLFLFLFFIFIFFFFIFLIYLTIFRTGRESSLLLSDADDHTKLTENLNIVSRTPINYAGNELLNLIHNHLIDRGLTKTAQTLTTEAVNFIIK